jgi:hypothetical protein
VGRDGVGGLGHTVAMPTGPLSDDDVERFMTDGFIRVERAFSPTDARLGCDRIWAQLRRQHPGFDPAVRRTWPGPVARVGNSIAAPFRRAVSGRRLTGAFDQLVGAGRWMPPGSLGPFPVRFPSRDEPSDAVWHVDASYDLGNGDWRLDVASRRRALLMFFLFTDVGRSDAPTRMRVGSHLDVPPVLVDRGLDGLHFVEVVPRLADLEDRPIALATGKAGDVYLCHPFLVHGADRNRGRRPRVMATPVLMPRGRSRMRIGATSRHVAPVEQAVKLALGR